MKKIVNYFLIGLAFMMAFTYLMGLFDDAFHKTGVWYKDIIGSIRYYVLWVLPYWWLIIVAGAVVVGLLSYVIKIGITQIKKLK